jgi:hypothetical protein
MEAMDASSLPLRGIRRQGRDVPWVDDLDEPRTSSLNLGCTPDQPSFAVPGY